MLNHAKSLEVASCYFRMITWWRSARQCCSHEWNYVKNKTVLRKAMNYRWYREYPMLHWVSNASILLYTCIDVHIYMYVYIYICNILPDIFHQHDGAALFQAWCRVSKFSPGWFFASYNPFLIFIEQLKHTPTLPPIIIEVENRSLQYEFPFIQGNFPLPMILGERVL